MKVDLKLLSIFILGLFLSLLAWHEIWLPFSNSLGVISLVTEQEYNPTNNILRFGLLCLIPVLLLLTLNFFSSITSSEKSKSKENTSGSHYLFIVCFILLATLIPTFLSWGPYDWFHEGDALAAAEGVRQGMTAYKDIFFVHGLYQDVYRILFAYEWFEPSIEAARSLESIHKIIAYGLLAILLVKLFKDSTKYWLAGAVLFALHGSSFLPPIAIIPREIPAFILLLLILKDKQNYLSLFFIATLPWLGILYSLDRGVYLFALLAVFIFLKVVSKEIKIKSLLSLFLGCFAGFLSLRFCLGDGLSVFFNTLLEMPKYHDLIMGKVYPIFDIKFLVAAALLSGALYWLCVQTLRDHKGVFKSHYTEIILLISAMLWFRNTLNRPDKVHLEYGMLFSYLFWLYVLIHYYAKAILRKETRIICKASICLVAIVSILNLSPLGRGLKQNFPHLNSTNSNLLADYSQAGEISKTIGDDEIFVMSADPTWHYILSKAPISGFSQAWFAATKEMQNKLVDNLEKYKVKWIIKDSRDNRGLVDGLKIEQRLPIIKQYLQKNYSFEKNINGVELYSRN